jgi:signal transduction histidine kinase
MRGRTALYFGILAALLVTMLLAFGGDQVYELPVRDALLGALPARAASATTVIAIDEASLRALGPWPWPRTTLASLVNRAFDGGARGVVLDVLLTEPREGDAELARALARGPSVAVSVLDQRDEWLRPSPSLHVASAHGSFELDTDGIVRRLASTKQSRDRSSPSISIAAASMLTDAPTPVGISIMPAFRTPAHAIPQISAAQAVLPVRGKIVFIGSTAYAVGDRFLTPTAQRRLLDPGVTVHAAATESLVRGETIRPLPPIVSGIVAGAIVGVLLPRPRRLLAIILVIVLFATAIAALNANIVIPLVTLLACAVLAHAAIETITAARSLRQMRTARESDVEAKRRLAHELKTPLASMRGLTQLLAQFDLSADERRRVTTLLESEAGKLQSLVQVMLDLERLPLRDFQTSSAVLNLGDLVTKRVEFLRASTDRALSVDVAPGVLVRADAALLERVIDNLVGNALKYTSDDVTIRVAKRDGAAMLEVADRGPGIAPADRTRIFDRFVRGATAAGTQGLGLGLSLVAEIARWHHGSVALDEGVSGGASFRVTIPRAN